MAVIPLALHIYLGNKLYLSERTSPGSWTLQDVLYDNDVSHLGEVSSISAGALSDAVDGRRGIICGFPAIPDPTAVAFLGDGLPATPVSIVAPRTNSGKLQNWDFWSVSNGAWFHGTSFFAAFAYFFSGPDSRYPILKSVDNGATWYDPDPDNCPQVNELFAAIRWFPGSRYVYWFGNVDDAGGGGDPIYGFKIFDMEGIDGSNWSAATGSLNWGRFLDLSQAVVGFGVPGGANSTNGIVPFPNGDLGVFYNDGGTGAGRSTYMRIYTPGSNTWGPEIVLASPGAGLSCLFANLLIDPSRELVHHLYYSTNKDAGNTTMVPVYQRVKHDGTIEPNVFAFPDRYYNDGTDGIEHGMILGGEIFIPYDNQATSSSNSVWVAPSLLSGPVTFVEEFLPKPEPGHPPSCSFLIFTSVGFLTSVKRRLMPEYIKRRNAPGH